LKKELVIWNLGLEKDHSEARTDQEMKNKKENLENEE